MKKFECEMLEENPRELFQRNPTSDLELWGPGVYFGNGIFLKGKTICVCYMTMRFTLYTSSVGGDDSRTNLIVLGIGKPMQSRVGLENQIHKNDILTLLVPVV